MLYKKQCAVERWQETTRKVCQFKNGVSGIECPCALGDADGGHEPCLG